MKIFQDMNTRDIYEFIIEFLKEEYNIEEYNRYNYPCKKHLSQKIYKLMQEFIDILKTLVPKVKQYNLENVTKNSYLSARKSHNELLFNPKIYKILDNIDISDQETLKTSVEKLINSKICETGEFEVIF